MTNPVLEAIFSRRSIRKFTDQKIERDTITLLLQAGMAAPSASNSQPWEFIVVDEPEALKKVKANMPLGRFNSPLCIIVCGSPDVSDRKTVARMFWVQDCSAAIENMLIAAVGLGLGSVWCGVHPVFILEKRIKDILNIPNGVTPLGVIQFGYPAETKEAGTKYKERRVHWQEYSARKKRICNHS
jgi:nitroreductase